MLKQIECVPNISEGRRLDVIDAICAAVSAVPGALLLDRSSDADHNRTVLTLIGSPEGLKRAILALYEAVETRIDLRQQRGRHPRMGAVDVVPFIPVRNATLEDCVALARETAEAVAARSGVPVYLYAEAATRPERVVLANIRKGEFEGLAGKMADPVWQPDYGPAQPHAALGASAIGARFFLIAYNLLLDTSDVAIAKAIARAVRASSGGLPYVQALGIFLPERGLAQVSMNLLRYDRTPLHRVQEAVKAEAARHGARVLSAEVVGLMPQAALLDAAAHYLQAEGAGIPTDTSLLLEAAARYLQIERWRHDLVLENAIQRAAHLAPMQTTSFMLR